MSDLRKRFYNFYQKFLRSDDLWRAMERTIEDSPYHREHNVLIHTDMVLAHFNTITQQKWDKDDLLGALACAFHDTGKPVAEVTKHTEERGTYRAYKMHEMFSARLWENWAVSNWKLLTTHFSEIEKFDIFRIGWIIEFHLPYKVRDKSKRLAMAATVTTLFSRQSAFTNVLQADAWGRISDDAESKKVEVLEWIEQFNLLYWNSTMNWVKPTAPVCVIPIAASGTGKTTYLVNEYSNYERYSYDLIRMREYISSKELTQMGDVEAYSLAFQRSIKDTKFKSNSNSEFIKILRSNKNVVVDNINISNKRRRFFISEATRRGYKVVALLIPISLELLKRNGSRRKDKFLDYSIQTSHYMGLCYPSYHNFHEIIVSDQYLP